MVSAAAFTVWAPLRVPVLVWLFVVSVASPAVIACGDRPTVGVDVDPLVAEPLLSVTGDPKFPPSILNCTEPVGVPPLDVTVAVKLTPCPYVEGFADELTVVVVLAPLMVSVWVAEVRPVAEAVI